MNVRTPASMMPSPTGCAGGLSAAGKALRDTRESTAVEFVLVVPVLLLFLGGIVDFGRAFYYRTELDQALRSGMQYALKAPTDGAGIVSVINQSTSVPISVLSPAIFCQCLDGTSVSCTSSCPVGQTPMRNYVRLEATYIWAPMMGNMAGLLPASPLDAVLFVRTQ